MCGDWRLQSTIQLGKQSVPDDPERWHQVFCVALTIEMDFRKITKQTETIRKHSYFYKYTHTHTHTHTHMGFPGGTSGKEQAGQFRSYKEVWV